MEPAVARVAENRTRVPSRRMLIGGGAIAALIAAGGLFRYDRPRVIESSVGEIALTQRDQLLAWRDGMLSFGGEALATAIRAFDRYGPVRIVIIDPELSWQKITGLFKASDPRGFAAAVAASFGGIVSSQGDVVRIFAKKNAGHLAGNARVRASPVRGPCRSYASGGIR